MEKKFVFIENARTSEYRAKLQLIQDLGIDPFTKENLTDPRFDPKEILYESEHWFAFKNQHAYNNIKHQFVFVCKEYAEALWQLSPEAQVDLNALLKKVCEENSIEGGGIITRFGPGHKSGATVAHLHVQLIEPTDGNPVPVYFGSEQR